MANDYDNEFSGDAKNLDATDKPFDARITDVVLGTDLIHWYKWVELEIDPVTGEFIVMSGGRSGTYHPHTGMNPTQEINNGLVGVGSNVRLWLETVWNNDLLYMFQSSGNVTGSGVFTHVPRWDSTGTGLEETAITVGNAGFATEPNALFIPHGSLTGTTLGTTPFILFDPECFFFGTSSQQSQLRIWLAGNGVGGAGAITITGITAFPFTSSSLNILTGFSHKLIMAGDASFGSADFSTASPTTQSNALISNVLMLSPGHNDTSNPVLPAIGGFYLSVGTSGAGNVDRNWDFHSNPGAGGVARVRINGTDLVSGTGDLVSLGGVATAGSLSP